MYTYAQNYTCKQAIYITFYLLIIFFFKFCIKNVNVFLFFKFQSNLIAKFLWKSGFSNFGHVTIFTKRKFIFWPPFWNETLFDCSFLLIYCCLRCIHILWCKYGPQFLRKNTQKWLGPVDTTPDNLEWKVAWALKCLAEYIFELQAFAITELQVPSTLNHYSDPNMCLICIFIITFDILTQMKLYRPTKKVIFLLFVGSYDI